MTYVEQQSRDADEVITSAPPLAIDGASLEDTWTGEEEEGVTEEGPPPAPRVSLSAELLALYRRNARLEILLAASEQRAEDAEAQVLAERERASACVDGGLRGARTDDLFFEVNRRFVEGCAAFFARPVATAAVPVAGDDAGDHARQDAS